MIDCSNCRDAVKEPDVPSSVAYRHMQDWKLVSAVLRGGWPSNGLSLPDHFELRDSVFARILSSEDDLELSATPTQLFLQVVSPTQGDDSTTN